MKISTATIAVATDGIDMSALEKLADINEWAASPGIYWEMRLVLQKSEDKVLLSEIEHRISQYWELLKMFKEHGRK